MADGVVTNEGSGGATFQTAALTWSGETMHSNGVFQGILTGSEGSWTYSPILGGAGAVAAGVQRVTLASDDPAVADLAAIEVLLTGIDADTDAIKTSIQIVDDWDESDRCKVNLIVGQAGIAGGAGAVGVTVPRVTLASDDPAVVSLQLIDDVVKAEDAGHSTGDKGVMVLAVRQDVAASLAGTDADYAPLEVDAVGRLHANATDISASAYDGTTLCTVKRFHVVTSTNGADLIAAVASKKFRILSFAIFSISGTITRFWLEDSDGTDIFGSSTGLPLEEDSGAAPPGFILPHNPHGWLQSPTANKDLHIGLTAAQTVVVIGTYIEVA